MLRLRNLGLVPKLALTFVAFAAVLLTGVGLLAYNGGRQSLREATISRLLSQAIEKEETLQDWLRDRLIDLEIRASSPRLISRLEIINTNTAAPDSQGMRTLQSNLVQQLRLLMHGDQHFVQVAVLHPESGLPIAATHPAEARAFDPNQPFFRYGKDRPYLQNPYYSSDLQRPVMVAAGPIRSADGRLLGVIVGEINLETIQQIVSRRSNLHQTDDAFLVDGNYQFITQPRFIQQPVILQSAAVSQAVKQCLTQESGVMSALDYRNVPVITIYRWLAEHKLCLVIKIDEAEALAPALSFGKTIMMVSILTLLFASSLSIWLARSITRPVLTLQEGASRFGQGQLDIRLPEDRGDELGLLARAFNAMAAAIAGNEAALRRHALDLEQRVAERTTELRESELRFRSIIESASDGIIIVNDAYDIVGWNRAAERLFGYQEQEVRGQPLAILMPQRYRLSFLQGLQRFKDTGDVSPSGHPIEMYGLRRDGDEFPAEISIASWQTSEGIFFSGIVRDISQRRQAEEALKQAKEAAESASRAKSNFLTTMSHEIRTPMNAIIGMADLLLGTELSPEQHDFVETIRRSGDSLLAIIHDILDFSKIEAEKLELDHVPFDLRECVEGSLDFLAAAAAEKDLDLTCIIEEQTPTAVIGDVVRLRQILVNLLSNAVKFTERGEIVVSVSSTPIHDKSCELLFSVRDTGIGIPAGYLQRLFQPFSQVDASTTRRYGGTGLGLAISKRLAELMGGGMWIESQVGSGTTVFFTVHAVFAPPLLHSYLDAEQPQLRGKRLLIVDDNATNREVLSRQVRFWGMLPEDTASPREALEWIRAGEPYDLAIFDLHMPEIDGLMLVEEVRRYVPAASLPIILLASRGRYESKTGDFEIAAFLVKPIKAAQLYSVLMASLSEMPGEVREAVEPEYDPLLAERLPLRILIAEDSIVNQKVTLKLLSRLGYRADVADNGLKVLEALERQMYDVVLMDVQMPELDGLETTREIRRRWSGGRWPRIIAMTANALSSDRELCLAAGMDDYLAKPVRLLTLQRVLERVAFVEGMRSEFLPATADAVDRSILEELRRFQIAGEPDLIAELIMIFIVEAPAQLAAARQSIVQGASDNLQRLAHTLKSSSSSLGARRLAALCAELEQKARSEALDSAVPLLERVEQEFERVRRELENELSASTRPIKERDDER
ncbi:MAG: hypothetical protein KatS3mg057_0442 [Herpetosiphonaceae bacterium]|nr:MAG: hypothetical protein KatS3mg057_0442 [Herpetosiphonaceae bacterium]